MLDKVIAYSRELHFAATRSASVRSFLRLAAATLAFHVRSKVVLDPGAANAYSLRINGADTTLYLRTAAGDIFIMYEVLLGRVYDLRETLGPAPQILDLGANVGVATLHFATAYPNARICSVEPDAGNFAVLQQNTAPFGDRITIVNAAVAAHTGLRSFRASGAAYNRALAPDGTPVQAFSVGDILDQAGFDRVSLVKIDIEGAEAEILQNPDWLNRVDRILIELHDGLDARKFAAIVEPRGFVIRHTHGTLTAIRREFLPNSDRVADPA